MRKKYLSALLFGALLVTSAGTFTSCKDYDDDINNLQEQVDGVKSQLADLESKINDGKWITNIADAEGGFTITFSDNSSYTIVNGKDGANGADGAAGAPGTQWTISEDGYWVCDGEKTDVKAVGQDGKDGQDGQNGQDGAPGQDAQPEVKKENGKWYLWNGTEFEELSIPAPAVNVPYYYIDPNDNNYAVLVISDENGANKKEIRLPLNEGLAQIKVLRNGDISINYAYSKEGSAFEEWNGPKAKPAKGELIVTQSADSILVQVTPANYDLASLKESLKIVNAENEDAPLVLGEPVPYSGRLTSYSRATSNTGMYLIPVKFNNVVNEDTEYYSYKYNDRLGYPYVSIFANEKVRSDYNGSLTLEINDCNNLRSIDISFDFPYLYWDNEYHFRTQGVHVEPGKTFTVKVDNDDKYLYDAYVTMYDGSDLPKDATEEEKELAAKLVEQSLANQVRYGIELDGLTIKCNDKSAGNVYFTVHYIDVRGIVKHEKFVVNYSDEYVPAETITSIESVNHVTTGEADNQYMIYDLAPYFEEMTEAERLVWNDEFNNGSIRFNVDSKFYIDEDGNKIYNAYKWTYEDPETGFIKTMSVNNSIFKSAVAIDANGEEAKTGKDVAKLKVTFSPNYDNLDVAKYSEGSLMTTITFENRVRNENGNYQWNEAAYFELPFTLDEPTAEELAEQYSYNSHYYDATTKQFIIVDVPSVNIRDLFASVTNLGYNDVEVSSEDITFNNGVITLGDDVEKGKVYTISGATFRYLNSTFELPAMNIKFVNSKSYTLNTASANVSVQSGTTEEVTISYAEKASTNVKSFYNVKDVFNKFVDDSKIQTVDIVDFVSPTSQNGLPLLTVERNQTTKKIVVTPTLEKASVDATATVKIKVTMVDGTELEGSFTVTVKAYPHN